ncbi:YciI family protein [Mesorhizobium sp. LHD-90]|uniref:YciI family protein n=1 Tax=Mesorhizobium sp. LHD-90 TaxID=3071414 RepID=UPI0027DECBDB|nr:YciI family protein [Mesorhizobium sp. LHD-90]MDQ6433330.1 YciI family protein [Mesorhizobium sp. LHD-90]
MQYLLMIYINEAEAAKIPPERMQTMLPAYATYTDDMKKAGVWIAGDRLRPTSAATTVRMRDDKTQVLDGPYADTKEAFGGYYKIEAPDLDAAISWAARCPAANHGVVEVRPIWEMQTA